MYYITPCNLYVKDETFIISPTEIHYMLQDHMVIPCELKQCINCNKIFINTPYVVKLCKLKKTDKYIEEQSVNRIIKQYRKKYLEERAKIKYGNLCHCIHREYDKAVKRYDLKECKYFNCTLPVCAITGKERDVQQVNIFYDKKYIFKKGFLEFETWERNLKYFKTRVARDIAEKYIEVIKKEEPEKLNLRIQTRRKEKKIQENSCKIAQDIFQGGATIENY